MRSSAVILMLALSACAASTSTSTVPAATDSTVAVVAPTTDTAVVDTVAADEVVAETAMTETVSTDAVVASRPDAIVYLPYYATIDLQAVPWDLVTDVVYAFARFDDDGAAGALVDDPTFAQTIDQLREIRTQHPGLRLILGVGGAGLGDYFPAITAPERVSDTSASLLALMDQLDFDGLDLDWEFPAIGTDEPANYVAFLAALRDGLDQRSAASGRQFLLGVAASGLPDSPVGMAGASATLPSGADVVDRWYVMAYDYRGDWSCGAEDWRPGAGHHAALFPDDLAPDAAGSVSVQRWIDHGVDPAKIRFGVPFYGITWEGVPPGATGNGIGQRCQPGQSGYLKWFEHETVPVGADCVDGVDDAAVAAWRYCSSSGYFASFDTPATIATKRAWALDQGLGGVFAWELGADDASFSMLRALAGA